MITAEEFLWNKRHGNGFHDHELPDVLIEFAKLHVEAALKEASGKAKIDIQKHDGFGTHAILNAYPLTNIK